MKSFRTLLVGLLLAPCTLGCTIVADLDSYVSADDIGCDMQLNVVLFAPHIEDPVYFQAVTREDPPVLRAMAIIDNLVVPDRSFFMPNAIGEGPHALNFWADDNDDGLVQTSPIRGTDHSWRSEDVCAFDSNCEADGLNCFSHVSPFVEIDNPIEEGNTLDLTLTGLPATIGFVEAHLVEHDADLNLRRVVGLYRRDDTGGGPTFSLELRGLALPTKRYSVDVLVDLNGDAQIEPSTEVFTVTESAGSAYVNPITLDVTTSDPRGDLPPERGLDEDHPAELVSPLPTP
ncbi:MAG: hypothetical protein R3B40_18870 [Polyangiales bacterium]|nr:hypothetical protein [Myxococcales bacterium]MCB9657787.1 hypothetical protein [Sandaracinaceae bacterium]